MPLHTLLRFVNMLQMEYGEDDDLERVFADDDTDFAEMRPVFEDAVRRVAESTNAEVLLNMTKSWPIPANVVSPYDLSVQGTDEPSRMMWTDTVANESDVAVARSASDIALRMGIGAGTPLMTVLKVTVECAAMTKKSTSTMFSQQGVWDKLVNACKKFVDPGYGTRPRGPWVPRAPLRSDKPPNYANVTGPEEWVNNNSYDAVGRQIGPYL